MNEAESLCTKLGILINGKFQCMGSPQHLKDKYGSGYNIQLTMHEKDKNNDELIA